MQINNYNISQPKTKQSFTALYFRTPKIQEKVIQKDSFIKFLDVPDIKNAIDKHNIVITDILTPVLHPISTFKFRGCTDVFQRGEETVPSGMKGPTMKWCNKFYASNRWGSAWLTSSYLYDNVMLSSYLGDLFDLKPIFEKIHFKNNRVKENFQENKMGYNFLKSLSDIKFPLNKYHVLISDAGNTIKCRSCTDLVQTGNNLIPAGLSSPQITYKENNKIFKNALIDHLDRLVNSLDINTVSKNKSTDIFL